MVYSETAVWSPIEANALPQPPFQPHCPQAMAPSAIAPLAHHPYLTTATHYQTGSTAYTNKKAYAQQLIAAALKERINNIALDDCDAGAEDAFFVADMGEIYRQHMRWKKNLPRVEPFYGNFPV